MTKSHLLPRLAFVAACVFFAFLYGFASSHFRWFPHSFFSEALDQASQLGSDKIDAKHHRHPVRYPGLEGAAAYGKGGAVATVGDGDDGFVRLISSYWQDADWKPGLRLVDRRGEALHSWIVDIPTIWSESPHDDAESGRYVHPQNSLHGAHLFDNGDVLFNTQYLGLVRMNAGGEVVWRLDRRTHHSVTRDDDGNFWVCEARIISDPAEAMSRCLGLVPPIIEDRALKVSPDGEVLDEFSLLDVVFASKYRSLFWTTESGGSRFTGDRLHMNDVEPLSATMAETYPMFEAGDLVVSLRNLNLVLVVGAETHDIKWSLGVPLIAQHDPDFIGDGWISVFNNNRDDQGGQLLGGSQVLAFRPHTGETRTIYPGKRSRRERRFYTQVAGNAQQLPGGHWLITESTAGRVFEIDQNGRTVWEWGQAPHGDGTVSEVLEARQYPVSRAAVEAWSAR